MRTTKVLIDTSPRPAGTHQDVANTLALVLPPGGHLVAKSLVLANVPGGGPWEPPNVHVYPNFVPKDIDIVESDGKHVVGFTVNNRDSYLGRYVEATFDWEGDGPDVVQTSLENDNSGQGEGLHIAFAVLPNTPSDTVTLSYRDALATAPWTYSKPNDFTVKDAPYVLHFPPGYVEMGAIQLLNNDRVRHRAIRLSAYVSQKRP